MLAFCTKAWVYAVAAAALIAALHLLKDRKSMKALDKWGTAAFIAYALHALEESVLPGGIWVIVNNGAANYPMNTMTYMLSGLLVAVGAVAVLSSGVRSATAIAIMTLCAIEAVWHCVVLVRESLLLSGVFYAPGFVTALLGFLPLSMVLLVKTIENRPQVYELLAGILLSVLTVYLVYIMPGQVLGSVSSPYAFTNLGFYS